MPGSAAVVSDILSNVKNRVAPNRCARRWRHNPRSRPAVRDTPLKDALWLCAPVLVTVLWFEALSSHTQFHLTVSSRSAAMAIAIVLSAMVISMQRRPNLPELWAQLQAVRTNHPFLRRKTR